MDEKMKESGLNVIIPLICTLSRASILFFSVLNSSASTVRRWMAAGADGLMTTMSFVY